MNTGNQLKWQQESTVGPTIYEIHLIYKLYISHIQMEEFCKKIFLT